MELVKTDGQTLDGHGDLLDLSAAKIFPPRLHYRGAYGWRRPAGEGKRTAKRDVGRHLKRQSEIEGAAVRTRPAASCSAGRPFAP